MIAMSGMVGLIQNTGIQAMNKTGWVINWDQTDRFQTCIERQWLFDDKPPLTERRWVDKAMLGFYIKDYIS